MPVSERSSVDPRTEYRLYWHAPSLPDGPVTFWRHEHKREPDGYEVASVREARYVPEAEIERLTRERDEYRAVIGSVRVCRQHTADASLTQAEAALVTICGFEWSNTFGCWLDADGRRWDSTSAVLEESYASADLGYRAVSPDVLYGTDREEA